MRWIVLRDALQEGLEAVPLLVLLRPDKVVVQRRVQTLDVRNRHFNGVLQPRQNGAAKVLRHGRRHDDPLQTRRGDELENRQGLVLEVGLHQLIGLIEHNCTHNAHERLHYASRIPRQCGLHSLSLL